MNSKKGISMISLIITIVIMLILLTTATIGGITTVNNSKKISFANEISTLENAIRNYAEVNKGTYPIKESVVLDLSTLKKELDQFSEETVSSTSKIVLNEIDYEKLNYTSLKYGNGKLGENDEYLVSISTGKVYYAKGLGIGNKTYFSYTDDLKNLLAFNTEKNFDEQKAVITFMPSTIDWTNKEIKVTVKVPISYIVSSVRVDDENISLSSQDNLYYYYIVTKASNYTVEVKYKKDSTSNDLTAKYSVNNYDDTVPTVVIDKENQVYLSNFTKNQIGYAKITSKSDDLSGIKYIKYEENSMYNKSNISSSVVNKEDVKSHFESNGSRVVNDTIPINKGVKEITVYIEDNTGNWSLDSFDVTYVKVDENDYIKSGLIAQYDGINNTGSGHSNLATVWKDLSGNGNDGTLVNVTWNDISSVYNGNAYVDCKKALIPTIGEYTIEIVGSISNNIDSPNPQYFISQSPGNYRAGITFELLQINYLNRRGNDSEVDFVRSNYLPKLNEKINVTVSKSESNKLYINSKFYNSNVTTKNLENTNTRLGTWDKNHYLYGNIYSVRIYDHALTDSEIKQNYLVDKARFGI